MKKPLFAAALLAAFALGLGPQPLYAQIADALGRAHCQQLKKNGERLL